MSNMEKIVREFETKDVTPARVNFSAGTLESGVEPVILQFGKTGQASTFTGSYSITTGNYHDRQHKETGTTGQRQ